MYRRQFKHQKVNKILNRHTDNIKKQWKIITWQRIYNWRTFQVRVQILMILPRYNFSMEVSPKIKDLLKFRKITMLSMNKQHLKVMKMIQMNDNLTIMEFTNFNKYLKTTTTQYLILYNRTHTNNGKKSTTNKNKLKGKQRKNNKTKPNLKSINNLLTIIKSIKTKQITKCGKMIIT